MIPPRLGVPSALRVLLPALVAVVLSAPRVSASLPSLGDVARLDEAACEREPLLAAELERELPGPCVGALCDERERAQPKTRVRGFELDLYCRLGGEGGLSCTPRRVWAEEYGGGTSDQSLFTGHYFDTETNLYYAKARYFDPELGRFLSQDSYLGELTEPPSLHRYLYANANPTFYTDPTGHMSDANHSPEVREQFRLWKEKENARKEAADEMCRPNGCIKPIEGDPIVGGLLYGAETVAEFVWPAPLGLSDPDSNLWHPLADPGQVGADYRAFKERYGREAHVAEGAAVTKLGGKPGKVIGPLMILGAVLFGQEKAPVDDGGNPREASAKRAMEVDGFKLDKHGNMPAPRPEGMESHHGAMSRWMEEHFPDYDSKKAPAVLMPTESHDVTRGIYPTWRKEMRQQMGGTFEWSKVTEQDIRALGQRMFEEAKAPEEIRKGYWEWFDRMKTALSKSPKPKP